LTITDDLVVLTLRSQQVVLSRTVPSIPMKPYNLITDIFAVTPRLVHAC